MTTPADNLKQAALAYAEMGYAVFPVTPGAKAPPLTAHGCLDASAHAAQVEAWWDAYPSANIAIATAGLMVIDIDGADNPWLTDQPERQLQLAAAPCSLTANGGRQFIYRQPPGRAWRNTAGRLAPHVDTRGNGGYILVAPSVLDGGKTYRWQPTCELEQAPTALPTPPDWLAAMLDALEQPAAEAPAPTDGNSIPEGQRNQALARIAGSMRRVGMTQAEILAALQRANTDRCRPPIPPQEVERIAASIARYEPDQAFTAAVEGHWDQMAQGEAEQELAAPPLPDPGPLPDELLRVPGFIGEVMDYCLATAPYPNPVMAFCGALALQAFLAGRRVRDPGDNRTNIYLLGLAHSAAGKDWPRKVNTRILHEIGLSDGLGDRFASGEGIQDALFLQPSMLFQTDEIDGMLQSINKAKDARHENVMGTLLTLYSASSSVFPMRRKAGQEAPSAIDQPNLVIFGTAIPNHYYEALSERMLTNGFFARMVILEAGRRGPGQEPRIVDLPPRVLETARWWANYRPGTGNLEDWHPSPTIVQLTPEAQALLVETRQQAEAEYAAAEARSDPVGTTVWGRVSEQTRKLALLHAVSANHTAPSIDAAAVSWAAQFAMHQTRRMLFMAQAHVADNPFHAECLKLLQKLRAAPGQEMAHSVLLKRMKTDSKRFGDLIETLSQNGGIEIVTTPRPGTAHRRYRLLE